MFHRINDLTMRSRTHTGCFPVCSALAWALLSWAPLSWALLAFAPPACGALAQTPRARAAPAVSARSAPRALRIGTRTLKRCPRVSAYCGHIDRPLDPTGAIPGSISIHFEYYPHSAPGNSAGTLVATEGGPGYVYAVGECRTSG
jgi:hypothetical protein